MIRGIVNLMLYHPFILQTMAIDSIANKRQVIRLIYCNVMGRDLLLGVERVFDLVKFTNSFFFFFAGNLGLLIAAFGKIFRLIFFGC